MTDEVKSMKTILKEVKEDIRNPDEDEIVYTDASALGESEGELLEDCQEDKEEVESVELFLIEYSFIDDNDEDDTIMLKAKKENIPDCWRGMSEHEEANGRAFNEELMHVYRLGSEVKILGYTVQIEDIS